MVVKAERNHILVQNGLRSANHGARHLGNINPSIRIECRFRGGGAEECRGIRLRAHPWHELFQLVRIDVVASGLRSRPEECTTPQKASPEQDGGAQ